MAKSIKAPIDYNPTKLDPIHSKMPIWDLPFSRDIWKAKYKYEHECYPGDSAHRVVQGLYPQSGDTDIHMQEAEKLMAMGLWLPAGRIWAGAGTSKVVTLMNCYVMPHMPDSMEGISDTLKASMLTMQQGGGIGVDFSTLRPKKAYLKRTQSEASGPIKFMETWDAMCRTIMSAGSRRGAMMATLVDTHPDLPEFILAKTTAGILKNFNVSVLVSDALMAAIEEDADWPLYFKEPTFNKRDMYGEFEDEDGTTQYIYSVWKARELWGMITENTYEYSEPGVIFIDRINDLNNLSYLEEIHCTNPCGEQPLPPNGACDLGAINLALCVTDPFTSNAQVNTKVIEQTARMGVRFLDNVIDKSLYPLEEQKLEERNKRRIGLGVTGLADMLAQLGMTYGTSAAAHMAGFVMRIIANAAYYESAELAAVRGPFKDYIQNEIMRAPFVRKLDAKVQKRIKKNGLRNGVILTVAPVGTTSVIAGNISSGIEPIFAHFQNRKVLQDDDTWKEYKNVPGFTARLYAHYRGTTVKDLPDTETHKELSIIAPTPDYLTVDDHLKMYAAVQEWVDASVSKTINIPADYPYEEFQDVYQKAYTMGCKGCTTYRPSTTRGSIIEPAYREKKIILKHGETATITGPGTLTQEIPLTLEDPARMAAAELQSGSGKLWERPDILSGKTYKIKWPNSTNSLYLTINDDENGIPRECFIQSRNAKHQEWTTALTLMISAILRRGGDITFVPRVLRGIQSMNDTAWIKGKFYGSLVANIGVVLESHFDSLGLETDNAKTEREAELSRLVAEVAGEVCAKCGSPAVISQEGCKVCQTCNHSTCD